MTTAADNARACWCGWTRSGRGKPWEKRVESVGYDATWQALLAVDAGAHADRVVLPQGTDPNRKWKR